jgi:Rps23 Pro-64 3,4-dihydroxylase Tpa1-like proline 4-hydroxylase
MEFYNDPYPHYVIDNFVDDEIAHKLSNEFMSFDSEHWFSYGNQVEVKKACNNWYHFPEETYKFFQYLNSPAFVQSLSDMTGVQLVPDHGLHGAGWHIQPTGGKLNVHLDYSIHPKLGLERKFNFIFYLTPNWNTTWGGNLEMWTHDSETNQPKELIKTIENKFNRAVIFDTTYNSWHGFSQQINCPEDVYRKSIAMYYLCEPSENAAKRSRALFAPTEDQKNDPEIMQFIEQRAK